MKAFLYVVSLLSFLNLIAAFSLQHLTKNARQLSESSSSPHQQLNHERGSSSSDEERRHVLQTLMGGFLSGGLLAVQPALAGEVGARITKAVTTSDLGISVRTSVVKGAQVMDQLDGSWEKFSDRFSLGSERSKQGIRPTPKIIPDPKPLNVGLAKSILEITDSTFLTLTAISASELQQRIEKVSNLVRPSFERSGLEFDSNKSQFTNGPQFNFVSYVHYKAYTDLLIEQKIPFGPFLKRFESQVGERLIQLSSVDKVSSPSSDVGISDDARRQKQLTACLASIRTFCDELQSNGLVAMIDVGTIDPVVMEDWVEDLGDLSFSIALDGDITQNAQILIQEQGFRFYPNYGRYGIATLLQQGLTGQKVTVEDYYFDTDYNSDPDRFEVKEVLLNIVLESL